jgi:hypothetical protein
MDEEGAREARWRAIVVGWGEGTESVAAYCRRTRVSASSFYRWRARLGAEGGGRSRFLPVKVVEARPVVAVRPPSVGRSGLEVVLRGRSGAASVGRPERPRGRASK